MNDEKNNLIITDDETDCRIAEGIEKNRKGNFTLKTDAAKVHVKLKKHKFKFGCNLFMLDEFPDDADKNRIYREKIPECFNMATLPFYWDITEPEEGKTRYAAGSEKIYRRPPADLCVEYCEKNGIEPREHALCYEHFFPKWLSDKSTEDVKKQIIKRMKEISSRYSGKIPTIEVTNEMFWGEKGAVDFYYDPEFMEFCYKEAAKYFPANTLCINEATYEVWEGNASPWGAYYCQIENLLLKGARIDAIGMQFHMFHRREEYYAKTRRTYNLKHDLAMMDNYSRFNRDFHITEVTVPAYTDLPEDEQTQADVLEKLYSMWFSYSNTQQIIYWNLVDGYAYGTTPGDMSSGENYYRGGLLRFDMSEKPAYKRLKQLITQTWSTEETISANCGKASFRGFYGQYEVTADGKTYIVDFDEDGKEICL